MVKRTAAFAALALVATACSSPTDPSEIKARTEKPVEVKITGFDRGNACLAPLVRQHLAGEVFAALPFRDRTGKENYGESGTGKFLGQGAENWVMASLSMAGVRQVNFMANDFFEIMYRQAPKAMQDRMRELALVPTKTLDGAFTGLGWTGGGGVKITYGGIGPSVRRFSTSISAVMTMTDVMTREVLKSTKYEVISTATEVDIGVFRVFGQELVEAEAGFVERQLLPFVEQSVTNWLTYMNVRSLIPDSEQAKQCDTFVLQALENTKITETDLKTGETKELVANAKEQLDSLELKSSARTR